MYVRSREEVAQVETINEYVETPNGKAHVVYDKSPQMTLEKAKAKLHNLEKDFPDVDRFFKIYNERGVAAFDKHKYALYFADPSEEQVSLMKDLNCDRYREAYSPAIAFKGEETFFYYDPKRQIHSLKGDVAISIE